MFELGSAAFAPYVLTEKSTEAAMDAKCSGVSSVHPVINLAATIIGGITSQNVSLASRVKVFTSWKNTSMCPAF